MFIAMNRFQIAPGSEEVFETLWRERESHLDEVPGFREFHLLRGPSDETATLYASHSVWELPQGARSGPRSEGNLPRASAVRGLRGRLVSGLRVGTPQQFRWLDGIVKTVLVMNLLDAIFTLVWVRAGLAREANVLMRDLVNEHAVLFVVAKLSLVSLGSLILWQRRAHAGAVVAIFVIFLVYYFVLLYHLQYSSLLVRHLIAG